MNRIDRAISECSQAVDKATKPYDFERDIAWSQLSFVAQENCNRQLRRQKRHTFYKWAGVVAFVVMVLTLALIWSGQTP